MNRDEAKDFFGFSSLDSISEDDIKSRYRELVKDHHPDVGGSEEEFKQLKEAKQVLLRTVNSSTRKTNTKTKQSTTSTTTSENTRTGASNTSDGGGFRNPYRNQSSTNTETTAQSTESDTHSSNTVSDSKTTNENTQKQSNNLSGKTHAVNDSSESHFINSILRIRQVISSFIGKTNIILFISLLFVGLSTHSYYLPFITQFITIPQIITFLFDNSILIVIQAGVFLPVIVYFDLRYQQDNSRKLLNTYSPQLLDKTIGIKSPLTFSASFYTLFLFMLMSLSFSGWVSYAVQMTPYGYQSLLIVYSIVVFIYVLVRPTIPTPAQFNAKFEEEINT